MKKFRKIITDRPTLSDAEINSTKKGFDEVFSKFQSAFSSTSGGFSIIGWTSSIIITALIGSGIWYLASNDSNQKTTKNDVSKEIFADSVSKKSNEINPPFADKLVFETFSVNNSKPLEIKTKNKNILKIPANSFVDKNGKKVTKDIEIKFIDYHNPVDVFLSGIPMKYDSAGTQYTFESAGMFQIFAKSKGENIYLDKGKAIEVSLNSKSNEPSNQYYFDTISNAWKYEKTEFSKDVESIAISSEKVEKEIEDYSYEFKEVDAGFGANFSGPNNSDSKIVKMKEKRKKHDSSKQYLLKVKGDDGKSKVIELYQNQGFKDEYYTVNWTSSKLKKTGGTEYEVILRKDTLTYKFLGKEAGEVKANELEKDLEKENIAKEERGNNRKILAEKLAQLRLLQNDFSSLLAGGYASKRILMVNELGTYNCDRPVPMPEMAEQGKCNFVDENGQKVNGQTYNIAQVQKNILWKYLPSREWYYSKKYDNLLWFVTNDRKIAILFPDKISEINKNKDIAIQVMEADKGIEVLRSFYN